MVEHEWVLKTAKNLGHSDWKVREKAVKALGRSKHPDAVLPLAKVMRQDKTVEVRRLAAKELVGFGPTVLPILEKAFQDPEWYVRESTALKLVEIGSKAVPLLGRVLAEDKHSLVREAAANALGHIGTPEAIPHLAKGLNDVHTSVQYASAIHLFRAAEKMKKEESKDPKAKALFLVTSYFMKNEKPKIIRPAFLAALKGKLTKKNARLYVKQLRAMEGKLK